MGGTGIETVFESIHERLSSTSTENSTATVITGLLPTILLESFIPGYGYIHKIVFQTAGFDITILVTLGATLWLLNKVYGYLNGCYWYYLKTYYMADVTISSRDEIHDEVIEYLAHMYKTRPSRSLMAETPGRGYWDLDNENNDEAAPTQIDGDGNVKWLNFADQDAKLKPQFTPSVGSHNFWHKGTYFRVHRQEIVVIKTSPFGDDPISDREKLTISCFGRSPGPIKEFLQEAKDHAHRNHSAKTVIRRPATKERRSWGGRSAWNEVARRPCRPMKTVVLDEDVKFQVQLDINEYLDPSTARWYAIRGIPYRRGYLFHGPPGTGKTSLTFALAGVFGLNIYVVSLLEPTLTEEELGNLFTNLPPRCIVLLEDIDTAGLTRVEDKDKPSDDDLSSSSDDDDDDEIMLKPRPKPKFKGKGHKKGRGGRSYRKGKSKKDDDEKKGISLSGLLNIIDGVASHEGRVLVMTTNHPEQLDEALIRPGRVDLQVAFTNATRHQVTEIFERMYTADPPHGKAEKVTAATKPHPLKQVSQSPQLKVEEKPVTDVKDNTPEKQLDTPPATPLTTESDPGAEAESDSKSNSPSKPHRLNAPKDILEPGELSQLAKEFSAHIEDLMFSPAEVQGFLLMRKKHPRAAVAEIGAWVEAKKKEKLEGGPKFGNEKGPEVS